MFWGKGRKKGIFREHDSLVMEAAWEAKLGHIVGKRSLGRAKQGQENRGNGAKVDVAGKSTPSCPLGGGQKPIVHPSGWSRGGFGTESRTRTSKFLMQVRQQDHRTRIGSKVG